MKKSFLSMLLMLYFTGVSAQNLAQLQQVKPVVISGTLSAQYTFFNSTGQEYLSPGSWTLSGSPTLTIYGVAIPFSFLISEKERSFRQPFNQFGLSPEYKWVKLHLGYRNLSFSEYSLAGHQIAGAGVEINHPKKFNFSFMYGRLLRAVSPQSQNEVQYSQTPAYTRKGFAIKAGYGDEKNKVNIFYFSASDDAGSISENPDSLTLTPKSNTVIGINTYQVFLKNFIFDAEFATSETNINTESQETKNIENGTALDIKTGFKNNKVRMLFKYLRIAPDFESLGKYFFQRDVRNITLDPGIDFFNKKLSVDLSFGFQRDHLDNNKAYKTERSIISGKLTARPWKFYLLHITVGNYSIAQQSGLYEPDPAIRVSQATFNSSVMQQFMFVKASLSHNLNVLYSGQQLNDQNTNTNEFTEFKMTTASAMYSLGLTKIRLQISASWAFSDYSQNNIDTRVSGPFFILSKTFLNKYTGGISYSKRITKIDGDKSRQTTSIGFSADAKFYKKHKVGFRFTMNDQKSFDSSIESFKNNRGDITYAFTF